MDSIEQIYLPKSKNYFIITHLFFIIIYSSNIRNILIKTLKDLSTQNKFLTIIKKILKNNQKLKQIFERFNADFLFIQMIKSCKLLWLSDILKKNIENNSIHNKPEYIVNFFECLNFNFTDITPISDNLIYFNLFKVASYKLLGSNINLGINPNDLVKSQPSNIPDIIIYRKKYNYSSSLSLNQFSYNIRDLLTFNDEYRKITYLQDNYVLNSFILSCRSTDNKNYALISGIKINDTYFIMASNYETCSIIKHDWSSLKPFLLRYNKNKKRFKIPEHTKVHDVSTQYYYELDLDYALLFYTKFEMSPESLELSNYSYLKSQDFSFDLLKDIYNINIDSLKRDDIIHNIRIIDNSKLTLDFSQYSDKQLKDMMSEAIYKRYNIEKSPENSSDSVSFHSAEQSFSEPKIHQESEQIKTLKMKQEEIKPLKMKQGRKSLKFKKISNIKSKKTPVVKSKVESIIQGNRSRRNLTVRDLNKREKPKNILIRKQEEIKPLKKEEQIKIVKPRIQENRSRRNLTVVDLNKAKKIFKEELDKTKKPTNISINIMQPKKSINRSKRNLTITRKTNQDLKKELNKTIKLFNEKLDNTKDLFQRQLNKTITSVKAKPKSNQYLKKEINNLKELFKKKINKTKNIFQEELHRTRELITEKLPIFEDIKKPKYKSRYQSVRFADYSDEIDESNEKETLQSIYSNVIKKELEKTTKHFKEELKDTIDLLKKEFKSMKDERTIKYRTDNDIKHLSLPTRKTEFDFNKAKSINRSNDLISENLKEQIKKRYNTRY